MVRLVNTDFMSKELSEEFYLSKEFDASQKLLTYDFFKQSSVYISKYLGNDKVYSLNLLSKKYLDKNEILVYVTDEEFLVLFNHKTIYAAKINSHYIADDVIKCILIAKHIITLLSIDWHGKNLNYLINSNFQSAIENILIENIKIKENTISKSLGDIDQLTQPMNELLSIKNHYLRIAYVLSFFVVIVWIMAFGLELFSQKVFFNTPLDGLKNEIKYQKRVIKKNQNILNKHLSTYNESIKCLSNPIIKEKQ